MKLTITTLNDHISTIEVNDDICLENFKSLCSITTKIAAGNMSILFNGNTLTDNKKSLSQFGIRDGDKILVKETDSTQPNANSILQNIDFSSISVPNMNHQTNSLNPSKATIYYETLRENPVQVAALRVNNPSLADAYDKGLDEFSRIFSDQKEARVKEQKMLSADPFDSEAQRMIAQDIEKHQIEVNKEQAIENNPYSYDEVKMLYIECNVNGHLLKAIIDSGAQCTTMSKTCAENVGIIRLLDKGWSGVVRGVGTQRILGRIHSIQIEIGGDTFFSSITVLEESADLLIGLDFLRHYKCTINLVSDTMLIGATGKEVKFLNENQTKSSSIEPTSKKYPEAVIKELTNLGFTNAQVIAELDASNGNKDVALASLISKSIQIPSKK